jgi:hypothetical protein
VIAFTPEHWSASARNRDRHHPGTLIGFVRNMHTLLCRPAVNAEFAVAALAVCHQVDIKAPVRRVNGTNSRDYASLCPDVFND